MASQPASLTDQQLLAIYRNAMGAIAQGQSYSINGRTMTRASLKDVWDVIQQLEERIAQAGGDATGTGMVLVSFNNAV